MKNLMKCRGSGDAVAWVVAGLLGVGALAGPAGAQNIYTLSSANSSVAINVGGGSGAAGMNSWLVDGFNQAKQQWFYYRLGDSSPNRSIDIIGNTAVTQSAANTLSVTYQDLPSSPNYAVNVAYTLIGQNSGSGKSHLSETITFYNDSASPLALRFFDYSDYDLTDLTGNTGPQSVGFSSSHIGPLYTPTFAQTSGPFSLTDTASSGLHNYTRWEANLFSNTLQTLTNGTPSSLNGATSAGPGDVTAAIEWDLSLGAGSSLQISSLIDLAVPEPSAAALMGLGVIAWAACRRNRTRFNFPGHEK
jgi:hypothetical protein